MAEQITDFVATPAPGLEPSEVQIGDKSYDYNSLSADARKLIAAVQDVERELARHKRIQTYLEISRRSLVQELLAHLPDRSSA
jgi:flagellar biosynthesis/type III secretory pathway M-ring protein FliF/YscJ